MTPLWPLMWYVPQSLMFLHFFFKGRFPTMVLSSRTFFSFWEGTKSRVLNILPQAPPHPLHTRMFSEFVETISIVTLIQSRTLTAILRTVLHRGVVFYDFRYCFLFVYVDTACSCMHGAAQHRTTFSFHVHLLSCLKLSLRAVGFFSLYMPT